MIFRKGKFIVLFLVLCLLVQPFSAWAKSEEHQETKGGHKKYIIGLHKNVDSEQYVKRHNGKLKKFKKAKHTRALIAELAPEDVESLKDSEEVRFIEEDAVVQTTEQPESIGADEERKEVTPEPAEEDEEQTYPQGIQDIGAIHAIDEKITGKNVKIAVFDTGISEHSDLKIAGGISFVEGVESYEDDNGHGTHVAGTIAALNNNLGIIGAAPKAELYAVKVLDEKGVGSYSAIIEAIDWAIENKLDIISMSLGGTTDSKALHEAIQYATQEGILVIASAGNEGEDGMLYPARYPEVLSVGAVDKNYKRANFSSVGPELDLVAPGVDILSTTMDGQYGERSGTSMAAPHVTGAAALLWSKQKKWDSEQIAEKLKKTATPLGPAEEYGSGFVNVAYALGLVDGPIIEVENPPLPNPEPDSLLSIQQFDKKLLGYVNELESLIALAIKNDDSETAKYLNEEKAKLMEKNKKLHEEFEIDYEKDAKENSFSEFREQSESIFQENEAKLQSLLNEYEAVIRSAREKFSPFENRDEDRQAEIEAADNYEPNNSFSESIPFSIGNSISSYISVEGDVDVYSFVAPKSAPVTISLQVPANMDYDLYVYDENEEVVEVSVNGAGMEEIVTLQAAASGLYYVVVSGYFDSYTPDDPYQLRLAEEDLYMYSPYDISLPENVEQIFRITPASDGMYRIFTGPYGGFGSTNDTVLELYADANLTELVAYNDDMPGSFFSEITCELEAGMTYYLKLRAYSGSVHARLQAQQDPLSYPVLIENTPLDATLEGASKQVYRFTAPSSGTVRFFTSPYAGGQEVVDTVLEIYSDEDLTDLIEFNDDFGDTLFSEIQMELHAGQTIYIALWAYSDDTSYVRLQANTGSASTPVITVSSSVIQESPSNDGSISATQVVTLANATFAEDLSTGVIVQPLPQGLSIQVTRISDTQLSISFLGRALNHENADDVLNAAVIIDAINVVGATTNLTSNPFSFDFIDREESGTLRYVYNSRNQLVQIYKNGVLIIEITYDENGNVLQKTRVQ